MSTHHLPSGFVVDRGARRRRQLILMALPFVLGVTACRCFATQVIKAQEGVLMLNPSGAASDFTRSIDFGPVRVSSVADHPIVLQNVGKTEVTITATLTSPTPADFYLKMPTGDSYTVPMAPGQQLSMDLRYLPVVVGPNTATVTITTTSTATPKYVVNVTGSGAESKIDVCSVDGSGNPICASSSPDYSLTINMGNVVPGMTGTEPLTIKDLGALPLSVTSITPTATTSTEFGVTPGPGPLTVAPSGQSSGYNVTWTPQSGGPETGTIQVVSNDPVNPTVLVHINGVGNAPQLCFSPAAPSPVEFGGVAVGTTAAQPLVITSCGTQPAVISSLTLNTGIGPSPSTAPAAVFGWTNQPTTPVTLAPNDVLTLNMTFTPTALGDFTGSVKVTYGSTGGNVTGVVPLDGQGVGCSLSAPATVSFGNVPTGGSATQSVVVDNTGTGTCTITTASTSGAPFTLPNPPAMSFTVAPGQSTTFSVLFQPTTVGAVTGTLTVASDAQAGPLKVTLKGAGITPPPCVLVASPASITFTGVSAGVATTQTATITNEGTDDCDIVASAIDPVNGGSTSDFVASITGTLVTGPPGLAPVDVPPGQSVTLNVKFTPSNSNDQTVTAEVDYYDDNSSGFSGCMLCTVLGSCNTATSGCTRLMVPVTTQTLMPKICIQPQPPVLSYGAVAAGQTKTLSFTATSCGQGALTIRGVTMEAGSSPRFTLGSVQVPQILAVGSSITVNATYKPTTTTGDFAQAVVLSNDPNTPKALVQLQGNVTSVCSTELACSVPVLTFPTMEIGRTATLSLTCTDVGTQPVTITGYTFSSASSGAFTATVGSTPETIQPGGVARVSVDYTPQAAEMDTGTITLTSNSCAATSVDLEGTGKVANYPPCLPPQSFTPVTKWYWDGTGAVDPTSNNVQVTPIVANLTDDNGDGVINVNDIPDVVFTSCASGACSATNLATDMLDVSGTGMIRAIHGATGLPLWDVTNPTLAVPAETQLATADLDGDNLPEIIANQHSWQPSSTMGGFTGHYLTGNLMVFDHTGHLEFMSEPWTGDPNDTEVGNSIAVADIDGDGFPEIFYGRTVFNYDGSVKFVLAASGSFGFGEYPVVEDITGDGVPEIVMGAYAFKNDGTLLWTAPGSGATCDPTSLTACATDSTYDQCDALTSKCIMASGPTMVLGMKINGAVTPVVVLRNAPRSVYLLNGQTGATIASAGWPDTIMSMDSQSFCSAAMSAADLDGDGDPEIIVPAGWQILAFKYDGTSTLQQMWTQPVSDYVGQCGAAGSAAFDFNGNGKADVVYHDEEWVYVFNGLDGTILYQAPRSSDTIFETPVVVDVDNDGHADILFTNDEDDVIPGGPMLAGVKALSNTGNTWPATRRVWSDHAYHQSEITDGDTVPRVEDPSWKTNNTWRANPTLCTPAQ